MASPAPRPDRSSDPLRQHLAEVRRGLFRLHKSLIDAERAAFERDRGPQTNAQFLQALIHDDYFAWLRPFTGLIVEMDEALAPRQPLDPGTARDLVARAGAMVEPEDPEHARRYDRACSFDPEVLLGHLELSQEIRSAREALG
jgi:hypothetical protein